MFGLVGEFAYPSDQFDDLLGPVDQDGARADFLAGRSLMPIQIELASSALGERWHTDSGRRECVEILDEATA